MNDQVTLDDTKMVSDAPTGKVTSERVRLVGVIAACDSALEGLEGSSNAALIARATSVRITRARARRQLAEILKAPPAAA